MRPNEAPLFRPAGRERGWGSEWGKNSKKTSPHKFTPPSPAEKTPPQPPPPKQQFHHTSPDQQPAAPSVPAPGYQHRRRPAQSTHPAAQPKWLNRSSRTRWPNPSTPESRRNT